MRILGLDYGDRYIGVAISDPFGWTAQALETIKKETENEIKKPLRRIAEIAQEYNVEKIVLGYPKNMDNTEGERCAKTNEFKERLEKRFQNEKIPVILWDERLSTLSVTKMLDEGNFSKDRTKRKTVLDKLAAVHILQGYLDSMANQNQ